VKKKKEKTFYKYQCTLTGEEFITTKQAPRPDDLMSVKAYYEMHADEDDRPVVMKMRLGLMPEDKPVTKEE
jgi:hypothetical protein